MTGMDFVSFLILLVVSLLVSGVLHYGLKYYATPGIASFFSKVVVGWVGAWLGSPVFGHWWEGVAYGEVYLVPAILGASAVITVAVDLARMGSGTRIKQ